MKLKFFSWFSTLSGLEKLLLIVFVVSGSLAFVINLSLLNSDSYYKSVEEKYYPYPSKTLLDHLAGSEEKEAMDRDKYHAIISEGLKRRENNIFYPDPLNSNERKRISFNIGEKGLSFWINYYKVTVFATLSLVSLGLFVAFEVVKYSILAGTRKH